MVYNAKSGTLRLRGADMDYVRFGTGSRILVMLPGLGESLRSVKSGAMPMAMMYGIFAKDFTVYMFGRRSDLPMGYSTKDMAADLADAMAQLRIPKADVLGVSMGGMIAQHFAADYPEKVNRLVLTVTSARPNPILVESLEEWKACAEREDHAAFLQSNLYRIYSDDYCRKNRHIVPVVAKMTKPKSYDRFFAQAEACRCHDAYDSLPRIQAPTFVIGGELDKSLGGDASREIAERIPNAALFMYPQWGHGLYEEAKDFNQKVYGFLMG